MDEPLTSLTVRKAAETPAAPAPPSALEAALRSSIRGEVRFDPLARTLYATDASIYEIPPAGVVFPHSADDVAAVVRQCHSYGTAVVPRGAGTGLTGGAVGPGVQLDLSRHMNRCGAFSREARTIDVEPGVVLDELNARLAPEGLMFAPDVATSSRATIGGMIANNSCGAHSIVFGRTVDHVRGLTVVLGDGRIVRFGVPSAEGPFEDSTAEAVRLTTGLADIRNRYHDEIARRFPRILRSNGGYGLDRLGPPGTPADPIKIICGSEGTLGIVVSATLNLVPIPRRKVLAVLHFENVLDALAVTPDVLRHAPAAVELIDRLILDGGRANAALARRCDFLIGDPGALLVVEFFGDESAELTPRLDALIADPRVASHCRAAARVTEPTRQVDVWNLRKSGLGLLMSKPGDLQPNAFVEDTAVDPARLREYIERFGQILARENVTASYYAHASVGCLHVRPAVNLHDRADVERMRRIAEAVTDLVLEFGGAVTGEHGDGIVRSCWIERMYGPHIVEAFREVKQLFDPHNTLNPHKIVDPWPMTEHLRYRPRRAATLGEKTHLDFSAHGGMAGLAGMCSGVGQCRQRLVGTMCPSYIATGDEVHTTRARANALRVALSDSGLLSGLDDPHLAEVMDLCLSCKACKSECPTGVDMARLKAEYLARTILRDGATPRARLIADMPHIARWGGRFPRLVNLVSQSAPVRAYMERRFGLDRRVPPPRFAHRTFRAWYRARRRSEPGMSARGMVVYFVDTWTNYFAPQVGVAAVSLLERAGFDVLCPPLFCCGRPAISKGLLADATQLARENIARLARIASPNVPIVGTEPSCILTLKDEYPQLVRNAAARRIAEQAMMIESFLRRVVDADPYTLPLADTPPTPLLYHAHCHQKALVGADDAVALLRRVWGDSAREIPSGCCGMAGSFGHEKEHYDVARAIGEQRLFPAVRQRGEAVVAVSGFSCREQIAHHTGTTPRHLIEHLADRIRQ